MLTAQGVLETLNKVFATRPTLWVEVNRKLPVSDEQKMALLTLMGEQPGIEEVFDGEGINLWGIVQLMGEVGMGRRLGCKVHKDTGRIHGFLWQGSRQVVPDADMEDGSYEDDDYEDEDEEDY